MALKSAAIIVVMILATKACFHDQQEEGPTLNSPKSFVSKMFKIGIKELQEIVDKFSEFNEHYSNISEVEQKVFDYEIRFANYFYDIINTEIESMIEKATQNASAERKIVLECMEAQQNQSKIYLDEIIRKTSECSTKDVPKIFVADQEIEKSLKSLLSEISHIVKKLDDCYLGNICLIEFVKDLSKLYPVYSEILHSFKDLGASFVKFIGDIPYCIKQEDDLIADSFSKTFDATVKCIREHEDPKFNFV